MIPKRICESTELKDFAAYLSGKSGGGIQADVRGRFYTHADPVKRQATFSVSYNMRCLRVVRSDGCTFEVYVSEPAYSDGAYDFFRCRYTRPPCVAHHDIEHVASLEGMTKVIPCMARPRSFVDDDGSRVFDMHIDAENDDEAAIYLDVTFLPARRQGAGQRGRSRGRSRASADAATTAPAPADVVV